MQSLNRRRTRAFCRPPPAAVKDGFPGELKALAKEVRGTLSSERARIEGVMSQNGGGNGEARGEFGGGEWRAASDASILRQIRR